jgi:hypothetical protein
MPAEPITLYSRTVDPQGVLELLRALDPAIKVVGDGERWRSIRIACDDGTLTLLHDPERYGGAAWSRQLLALQNQVSRFPGVPRTTEVLRLIGTFRFVLGTRWQPALTGDGDERLSYLFAVAEHLDGVICTPTALRDAGGFTLIDADGTHEEEAVLPGLEERQDRHAEEDEEPVPPTAERVALRALALAAACGRGLLEQHDPAEAATEERRQRLLEWADAAGLGDELEPDEWALLQCPTGSLARQDVLDATWRVEGLVVLAWALNLVDMPPHDLLVEVCPLFKALSFLDAQGARTLQTTARLRPAAELCEMQTRLQAIHWRLRDFTERPAAMDFVAFAEDAWFGPFDASALPLIDGDLAVRGQPISAAPRDSLGPIHSAARERHLASNWLRGFSRHYSRTDTPT